MGNCKSLGKLCWDFTMKLRNNHFSLNNKEIRSTYVSQNIHNYKNTDYMKCKCTCEILETCM